jgi:PST family polysaccharide transporter
MSYFQLFIDFGFMLSATKEVSEHRNDTKKVSNVFTCVMILRLILIAISFIALNVVFLLIPSFAKWSDIFTINLIAVALDALLPAFLFRGMENMRAIAIFTLTSKIVFTALTFVFVRDDSQYLNVVWLRVFSAVTSLAISALYARKKYKISFVRVSLSDLLDSAKNSGMYFISRIASTVYQASNVVVLGTIFPTSITGIYSSAEKILTTGRSFFSPIADSLFPRTVVSKNYKSCVKVLKLVMPILTLGCVFCFIFAEPVVTFIFGEKYANAAPIFRVMIPIIWLTLPNYVVAFPILTPLGCAKQSNLACLYGGILHILQFAILFATDNVTVFSVAVIALITETFVFIYRLSFVFIHRKEFKEGLK